jgi:adenylate cyclase
MNTVSKSVVGELNQKLSNGQIDKLNKIPTKSLEAYNEYLQGQQLLQTRTIEKMQASIINASNAIKLDSEFADAYTNIATAYFILGEDQFMDSQTATRLAEKNALTAIRLDAENGRAYAILGNIYKTQNKWEQAVTTFQIALKFSPNDAQINYWYSLTLRSIGLLDEAIKYSTKAVALDPLSNSIYGGHIIGCAYAAKFNLAEKAIKEGELLFNEAYLFHNAKGFYFITRKNYVEALNEFKICRRLNPKSIYFEIMMAYAQSKLGQKAPALSLLNTLPNTSENYKNFSAIYAGLGDKENCLKYLDMAAEINNIPNYLKVSPLFTFLHNDLRFNKILQKAGLLNVSVSIK